MKLPALPLTVLILIPLLTACGGGGGGGRSSTGEPDPDSDTVSVPTYVQRFNSYLPLTEGGEIYYQDSLLEAEFVTTQSRDSGLSNRLGTEVYRIDFASAEEPTQLFFSSTPAAIELHEIGMMIEIPDNNLTVHVTGLTFDSPVRLLNADLGNLEGTVVANITLDFDFIGSLPISGINVDYSVENVIQALNLDYGTLAEAASLPVVTSHISINIDDVVTLPITNEQLPIKATIETNVQFTKGIGIVRHFGNIEGQPFDSAISRLGKLPITIWFENNNGNPILASGSEGVFKTDEGDISSTDYFIANQQQINALGWIEVMADSASDSFVVTLKPHPELPNQNGELNGLTSVEVVFEQRNTGVRMSGNVTLLANPL